MPKKLVLGIETSCDDTSVCLLRGDLLENSPPEILAHLSFNGEVLLQRWRGVVPEVAARNHVAKLCPLLEECFKQAKIELIEIDLVGVTAVPGLLGPLLTGLNAAKTISLMYEIPLMGVNHLYAHLEIIHLQHKINYPYIGLLVSGGHSIFFLVRSSNQFDIIGKSLDDAAGEAFDKGGKLLGLNYPAGRVIDEYAQGGDKLRFKFPIAFNNSPAADLSFSGVKTSLRFFLEKNPQYHLADEHAPPTPAIRDLCASYQHAIVMALNNKLKNAINIVEGKYGLANLSVVVGGGVACNSALREKLNYELDNVYFVEPKYCTDNGAMIANYAYRNLNEAIPFPQCLKIDASSRI